MSDYGDKLTSTDVQSLFDRANTPLPGPALAVQKTLRKAVAQGEAAFVDQATYAAAQNVVEALLRARLETG